MLQERVAGLEAEVAGARRVSERDSERVTRDLTVSR
jgi:hypothetical protein